MWSDKTHDDDAFLEPDLDTKRGHSHRSTDIISCHTKNLMHTLPWFTSGFT